MLASGIGSTVFLSVFGTVETTAVAGGGTVVIAFLLYRSFRKQRGIRAHPPFPRQQMREREPADSEPEQPSLGPFDDGVGPEQQTSSE